MIVIDADLLLCKVLQSGETSRSCLDDAGVLERVISYVGDIMHEFKVHLHVPVLATRVFIAVPGSATADVLERRRREAYVRAATLDGCRDQRILLPGTLFWEAFCSSLCAQGWQVDARRGSVLATIALLLSEDSVDTSPRMVFARERDASAIVAMCAAPMQIVHVACDLVALRAHETVVKHPDEHTTVRSMLMDRVVIDILTEGGCGGERLGRLIQDLPGLPRMPGTFAADAMDKAYIAWKRGWGSCIRSLTVSGTSKVDRGSLADLLSCYIDTEGGEDDDRTASPEWAGPGWRVGHITSHFPHGFDGACAQYLEAIDRELLHLSGGMAGNGADGVYTHGHAPSAMDLVSYLVIHGPEHGRGNVHIPHAPTVSVVAWNAAMQLAAITPRSAFGCKPLPIHTRLGHGCVHMFPTTYSIWWDKYPVIPALDQRVFEAGYNAAASTHAVA